MPRSPDLSRGRLSAGALTFLGAAVVAGRGVSEEEAGVFRAVNDSADALLGFVWVPMQFGTFATVPVLGALAMRSGRKELALRLAVAGTGAYVAARFAKRFTRRGRPGVVLPQVHLRGVKADDDGFPSGHAAVSTAVAATIASMLPAPWRGAGGGLAVLTGFGRMYVGAHLPLDVIGGAGIGLAIASAVEILRGDRGSEEA
jgi:membrane-associated phospholipid phosphatase